VRTYVYIDGFNLYYGSVKGTPYRWLNVVELCRRLMPDNDIERVHYFTARVKATTDDPGKQTRQQTFIRALETLPEVKVTYGSFLASPRKMPLATARRGRADDLSPDVVTVVDGGPTGAIVLHTEEKGSDVNIATTLVADAFRKRFEVAAVLSVDSDLALPITLITTDLRLPVGVLFPRHRFSVRLANIATFRKTIDKADLKACQFPDEVLDGLGRTIRKPEAW
jgi:hypothetical protein